MGWHGDQSLSWTKANLRRRKLPLEVKCRLCGHEASLTPDQIPGPEDRPIGEIYNRFKCSKCGNKDWRVRLYVPTGW